MTRTSDQPLTPEALGFEPREPGGVWRRVVRGQAIEFRRLHTLSELAPVEELQRETFGATDLDVIPASELVVVPETGGLVLAAYLTDSAGGRRMIAGGFAWGGFVRGRPRLVSDFLGVRPEARSLGIGAELKRLQAALGSLDGYEEIVWTVDPLRAANARLNFHKLGAYSRSYERDRYGQDFAQAHYGGLPSDRLHLVWPLPSTRVRQRLQRPEIPLDHALPGGARLAPIPDDIDQLLATDRQAALAWRLHLRHTLEAAFADGWAITGFAPAGAGRDTPALVLEQLPHRPGGAPDIDAARAGRALNQGDDQ